jgi:DNA-binding HxlR family transcriptional regulator
MDGMTAVEARSECVISNVLELFGDKWTFLVIRDMFLFNKHEFKEFLNSPERIATNVLTDRLKRLLAAEVIGELPHPDHGSRKLYYLTEKGKDLFPILAEMAKWGSKHMSHLPAMQSLYARMREQPGAMRKEMFQRISAWEKQYLGNER